MKDFSCTTKIMANRNVQIHLLSEILKENHVYMTHCTIRKKKFYLLDLGTLFLSFQML